MTMEDKDRVDAYIKLAEYALSRRNMRRQHQVRIALATWAAMAAAIVYVKIRPPELFLDLVLIAIVAVQFFGLAVVEHSHSHDRVTSDYWFRSAENLLHGVEPPQITKRTGRFQNLVALAPWLVPSIMLAIAAHLLLGTPN
jgi:hypothetical protein